MLIIVWAVVGLIGVYGVLTVYATVLMTSDIRAEYRMYKRAIHNLQYCDRPCGGCTHGSGPKTDPLGFAPIGQTSPLSVSRMAPRQP